MVTILGLGGAIALAAALVWVASAIVWMALPHHKGEYQAVGNEEAARSALSGLAPGLYDIPHVTSPADMQVPENKAKMEQGPRAFITVVPTGIPSMGKGMFLSFAFYVLVSIMVAYVASRSLPAGADYLTVFQVTGTVAWLAYGFSTIQEAIWFGRPWSAIGKGLFDAFVYANVTGGVFGWLWPAAALGTVS